ncbi:MAG: cation transporter [Gemmatimonadetes bacterium]|nr:cation transporter [Gemmatimonadota bacterium]
MSPARVPRDRTTQIRRVLFGLLVANLAVVGAKFVIGLSSRSLAVIGDGVHSSVDAINNVLALAVMWVAAREPDEEHPYGHTKFETLGALAIVMFLSISGFELVRGALIRLVQGSPPLAMSQVQFGILGSTLLVNTMVAVYENRRGHQLDSDILLADAAHTRVDVFITIAVLGGVLLARAGYGFADPIMALVVAGMIVWVAWGIVRRSVPVLVDEHALPAVVIRETAEEVTGVHSAYQIRSRGAPHLRFAEVTIAVDRGASVEAAHRIADAVEDALREKLQLHEVVVHIEPC